MCPNLVHGISSHDCTNCVVYMLMHYIPCCSCNRCSVLSMSTFQGFYSYHECLQDDGLLFDLTVNLKRQSILPTEVCDHLGCCLLVYKMCCHIPCVCLLVQASMESCNVTLLPCPCKPPLLLCYKENRTGCTSLPRPWGWEYIFEATTQAQHGVWSHALACQPGAAQHSTSQCRSQRRHR